jgi:hypothetical protein
VAGSREQGNETSAAVMAEDEGVREQGAEENIWTVEG